MLLYSFTRYAEKRAAKRRSGGEDLSDDSLNEVRLLNLQIGADMQ